MDLLHDQALQFAITALLGILSLFLSITLYKKGQEKKLINWDIVYTTSLSSFNILDKLDIQVLYSGKPLPDVSLVDLKIWNAGNKEITQYAAPIKFTFQEGATILQVKLLDSKPNNLAEKEEDVFEFTTEYIQLKPIVLNRGDAVTLRVLLTPEFNWEIKQHGRIVGGHIQALTATELPKIGYITSAGLAYAQFFLLPSK